MRDISYLPNMSGRESCTNRLGAALEACRLHAGGWPWDQAVKLAGSRQGGAGVESPKPSDAGAGCRRNRAVESGEG
jgi:hypothetical protein